MIDTAVKNTGSAPATIEENWPIVYWVYGSSADLAGSHWGIWGPPGGRVLMPGEEINVSMWECIVAQPPGTIRQLYYKADPSNKIYEASETNNELTCQYTIPQYSTSTIDVAVLTVQPTPLSGPSASTLFKFTVTVKNVGNVTVPTTNVTCSPGAGTKTISALAPGATQTVTLEMTYHMPAGQKTVTCTASADNDANSANNKATATFTVTN
jgi:subtilase family serine protease